MAALDELQSTSNISAENWKGWEISLSNEPMVTAGHLPQDFRLYEFTEHECRMYVLIYIHQNLST